MKQYFKFINQFKSLNKNQELELAKDKQNPLNYKKLLYSNLKNVVSMAKQITQSNPNLDLNEIINSGNTGLVKSIKTYTPTKNKSLFAHARWYIKKEIYNTIFKQLKTFKYSTKQKHFQLYYDKIVNEIEKNKCDSATTEDIEKRTMEWLKCDEMELSQIMESVHYPISLNCHYDDKHTLEEFIYIEENHLNNMITEETYEIFYQALETLSEREYFILCLRYGIDNAMPLTLDEISKEFNLSGERIRQVSEEAIAKIRKYIYIHAER